MSAIAYKHTFPKGKLAKYASGRSRIQKKLAKILDGVKPTPCQWCSGTGLVLGKTLCRTCGGEGMRYL